MHKIYINKNEIIVSDHQYENEHDMNINVHVVGAHKMSQITRVAWRDNNTVISTGQDSNVKQFKINAIA